MLLIFCKEKRKTGQRQIHNNKKTKWKVLTNLQWFKKVVKDTLTKRKEYIHLVYFIVIFNSQ